MRKRKEAVSVRVDANSYKCLKLLALSYGQSITAALASMVREYEHDNPMTFTFKITRVIDPDGGEQIDLTVNGGESIWFGPTVEGAIDALAAFRKEHGYSLRRFKLQKEIEVLDFSGEVKEREALPKFERLSSELNFSIVYHKNLGGYHVYEADTEKFLFEEATLQKAWDEIKDECERRGVKMGGCDLCGGDPSEWDEINK